ncbi:DUF1289 domain-containing protein [Enterovirga sp. CN4-39]|uniref:DUF1289 domain-containing protein n=1 Tax=Enterovirga sp. CN4-39 TaxID=3400910 RepID=UPI003BFEB6EF
MPRVSSPCLRVCILDPESGLCEGCGRTRDEIARWGSMSEDERLAIMAGLDERMRRLLLPERAQSEAG